MSAPAIYTYANSAEMTAAAREKMIMLDESTPGGMLMPMVDHDTETVMWNIRDNVQGLMLLRDQDAPFPESQRAGNKTFSIAPARLGEKRTLPERFIESGRMPSTIASPIDVTAELAIQQDEVMQRMQSAKEYMRWRVMTDGVVTMVNQSGASQEVARWTRNLTVVGTLWTTPATATPLQNFRTLRDTKRGLGHAFDNNAIALATNKTWSYLLTNTNANDFGGKRNYGLRPINGINEYNEAISYQEGIPKLAAFDDGYLDSTNTLVPYIPDGYIVVVGYNPTYGLSVGEWACTRNAANMGNPGLFSRTGLTYDDPQRPFVTVGLNGGPTIRYANQVQIMQVA